MSVRDDLVRSFRWVDGHADVWRWFSNGELLRRIVEELADPFRGVGVTKVATLEARGFVWRVPSRTSSKWASSVSGSRAVPCRDRGPRS
jgi:hypothetical protein